MLDLVKPLDADTLERMLRYGLATAADRLVLRPGHRPMVDGLGGPREIQFRQLCGDDTRDVAGHFLAAASVSERARQSSADAAREIFLFMKVRGGGLAEAILDPCPGGVAVTVELIPPLPEGDAIELIEA